jgi:hypothetical protein
MASGEWRMMSAERCIVNYLRVKMPFVINQKISTYMLSFAIRHSPFATSHSPLAIRHSPLVTSHSPLAIYLARFLNA